MEPGFKVKHVSNYEALGQDGVNFCIVSNYKTFNEVVFYYFNKATEISSNDVAIFRIKPKQCQPLLQS